MSGSSSPHQLFPFIIWSLLPWKSNLNSHPVFQKIILLFFCFVFWLFWSFLWTFCCWVKEFKLKRSENEVCPGLVCVHTHAQGPALPWCLGSCPLLGTTARSSPAPSKIMTLSTAQVNALPYKTHLCRSLLAPEVRWCPFDRCKKLRPRPKVWLRVLLPSALASLWFGASRCSWLW